MPAAYDIYSDQLRELRRGQPLYYPEPSAEEGPVEIGDVGYTRQGAFCRLFNVARSGDDSAQTLGVPTGFQPLEMGRILTYDAALEPGPLHSKTIFRVHADVGTAGTILPADASFRFSCTSSRGAILMLETQMSRQQALHDHRFKNYLLQHYLSWYSFARELGVQVEFGDIVLVTECSKTAAWASAVYSQSSKEFGMSFSAGGTFLPSTAGVSISAGLERVGPVEYRRSQRRAIALTDRVQDLSKDHTVFIRGYRLGSRSLYLRSLARKIMRTTNRARQVDQDSEGLRSPTGFVDGRLSPPSPISSSQRSQPTDSSSELVGSYNASALFPEWPDFHPAVALLANEMETTDVEIAAVHDDDWCSSYSEKTSRLIDDYTQCFFNDDFLDLREGANTSMSNFFLTQVDHTLITPAEEKVKHELLMSEGILKAASLGSIPFQCSALSDDSSCSQSLQKQTPAISPAHHPFFRKEIPVVPPQIEDKFNSFSAAVRCSDTWSITLLGDGGVGKTALALQFTNGSFLDAYDPTVEETYQKKLAIDDQECCLNIVDTAGQEQYRALTEQWVRQGQAFVLVYSVASRSTFERIELFIQLMSRVHHYRHFFVLVANKIDQNYLREVSKEEGEKLARSLGCEYIETSAKKATCVRRVFVDLVRILRGVKPMFPGGKAEKCSVPSQWPTPPLERKSKSCILM